MAVRRPWLMVSSIDSYPHAQPWQPVPAYTISFLYVQCKSKAGVSSTSASNSLDERARCVNSQLSRESSQNMSVEIHRTPFDQFIGVSQNLQVSTPSPQS